VTLRLPVAGRIEAHLIWSTGDRAGFQFERIIRPDDFTAMMAALQPNPRLRRGRKQNTPGARIALHPQGKFARVERSLLGKRAPPCHIGRVTDPKPPSISPITACSGPPDSFRGWPVRAWW
jgi:hypothetical protein